MDGERQCQSQGIDKDCSQQEIPKPDWLLPEF
jgi:hypothetical protein